MTSMPQRGCILMVPTPRSARCHPGFWRTKCIALKGLHRNCPAFTAAFCIRVLCNPFRVQRKNYGIHTQGGASAYSGLHYSALSGHNTTIPKHLRKLRSFMYGFLFKRLGDKPHPYRIVARFFRRGGGAQRCGWTSAARWIKLPSSVFLEIIVEPRSCMDEKTGMSISDTLEQFVLEGHKKR